jgi:hypothetical protein
MVLLDLDEIEGPAGRSKTSKILSGAPKDGGMAAVKSVKRLSSCAWPFSVQSSPDHQANGYSCSPQSASSFVT